MTVMTESKIAATHRLQQAGHWNAASVFRDRERLRLREAGHTRSEARELAWLLMNERFQPTDYGRAETAILMAECPPKLDAPETDQWEFTTAWQATWFVVCRLAAHDRPLCNALGIEDLTCEQLESLKGLLPIDEQERIADMLVAETDEVCNRLARPRAEPLLDWAKPRLQAAFEMVDREALDGAYEGITFEYFERLIDAWALLEESVEFFWKNLNPVVKLRHDG